MYLLKNPLIMQCDSKLEISLHRYSEKRKTVSSLQEDEKARGNVLVWKAPIRWKKC